MSTVPIKVADGGYMSPVLIKVGRWKIYVNCSYKCG